MSGEIWIDIAGYDGDYQISSYGRVRSTKYGSIHLLQPFLHKNGYLLVQLYTGAGSKKIRVHRLVASHFVANPDGKPIVNHLNGDKTDNRAVNLQWCTSGENNQHAYDAGLKTVSSNHIELLRAQLSRPVYCVELGSTFDSASEASRQTGVAQPNISACCRGERRSAGKHPVDGSKLTWVFT